MCSQSIIVTVNLILIRKLTWDPTTTFILWLEILIKSKTTIYKYRVSEENLKVSSMRYNWSRSLRGSILCPLTPPLKLEEDSTRPNLPPGSKKRELEKFPGKFDLNKKFDELPIYSKFSSQTNM